MARRKAREAEKGWHATVVLAATAFGYEAYHTLDSRGSAEGFPDLVCKRRDVLRFVAELKAEGEEPTAAQWAWLRAFAAAGIPAYVWRPSDWPDVQRALRKHA